MSEVKYVAISEELRDWILKFVRDSGYRIPENSILIQNELRAAPQAEVKRRQRTHLDLAGAVAVGFDLPIGWANEQTDATLIAMLTKIGVETTEVCR